MKRQRAGNVKILIKENVLKLKENESRQTEYVMKEEPRDEKIIRLWKEGKEKKRR